MIFQERKLQNVFSMIRWREIRSDYRQFDTNRVKRATVQTKTYTQKSLMRKCNGSNFSNTSVLYVFMKDHI